MAIEVNGHQVSPADDQEVKLRPEVAPLRPGFVVVDIHPDVLTEKLGPVLHDKLDSAQVPQLAKGIIEEQKAKEK